MRQRPASTISGESLPSAGAVIGTMAFICAIYLLTTSVGLSRTFANYADHATRLVCGDFGAFSNYKHEPLFFLIMWVGSEIWNFLFFPGCTPVTSSPNFWLPVFLAGFFILQFSYVTRHLRWFAVYYHIALCLDAGLVSLPFHLLRQFIAVVIVVMALSMLLRKEIGPGKFVAYLIAASLTHFSAWLLVALALVALAIQNREAVFAACGKATRTFRGRWLTVVALGVLCLAAAFYYELLAAKIFPRFDFGLSVMSVGLRLGSGSGIFSLINIGFVCLLSYGARSHLKDPFAKQFVSLVAISYLMFWLLGADSLVVQRTYVFVLAIAYFGFLFALRSGVLSVKWQTVNFIFLAYEFSTFFFNSVFVRAFDARRSFSTIGLF